MMAADDEVELPAEPTNVVPFRPALAWPTPENEAEMRETGRQVFGLAYDASGHVQEGARPPARQDRHNP